MTDTTLPPEVAEAIDSIDDCMRMDIKVVPVGPLKVVRDYCDRLAEENARLRPMLTARSQEMLRLVSESGELKTRAEKAESERDALKARIAEAPVVQVDAGDVIERLLDLGYYKGKPLALLPLDDETKS